MEVPCHMDRNPFLSCIPRDWSDIQQLCTHSSVIKWVYCIIDLQNTYSTLRRELAILRYITIVSIIPQLALRIVLQINMRLAYCPQLIGLLHCGGGWARVWRFVRVIFKWCNSAVAMPRLDRRIQLFHNIGIQFQPFVLSVVLVVVPPHASVSGCYKPSTEIMPHNRIIFLKIEFRIIQWSCCHSLIHSLTRSASISTSSVTHSLTHSLTLSTIHGGINLFPTMFLFELLMHCYLVQWWCLFTCAHYHSECHSE
jgi:hypothetical protein